jgi:hypothetical protein
MRSVRKAVRRDGEPRPTWRTADRIDVMDLLRDCNFEPSPTPEAPDEAATQKLLAQRAFVKLSAFFEGLGC